MVALHPYMPKKCRVKRVGVGALRALYRPLSPTSTETYAIITDLRPAFDARQHS